MKGLVMLIAALIVTIFIVIKYADYSSIIEFLLMISSQNNESIEINPNYKNRINIDLIVEGLSFPTSMTFVGNNSILVLEKDRGNVRLVSNGILQKEPVYTVKNISNEKEQGLLGIAATLDKSVSNNKIPFEDPNFHLPKHQNISINPSSAFATQFTHGSAYKIYLYVTEKTVPSPSNDYGTKQFLNNTTTQNRVYEYDWIGPGQGNLSNPNLLLELPSGPDPYHIGGKMHMDEQDNLYIIIGDLVTINNTLQNYPGGKNKSISIPNNSSVIFRINPLTESMIPKDNPFYTYYYNNTILDSAKFYYSYGI
ncbi:MAG TPA: hypothetical protein VFT71_02585, partial [Candidatus Nitrosocosmicus sp.]|nr:hypothetical protein [Candidatus Nitrosocosmicus sp.]